MEKPSHNEYTIGSISWIVYKDLMAALPVEDRVFTAHMPDTDTITLYQAYKPSIARPAVEHQAFTASRDFRLSRMTWVKPGFLWMMYRSGWACKGDQEHILAVHVRKAWLFHALAQHAILSVHANAGKVKDKDVVIQWDPDHDYRGNKLARRAIQIGMRGAVAADYAAGTQGPAVVRIEDITSHVCHQRDTVLARGDDAGQIEQELMVPAEVVVELDEELQQVLGLHPKQAEADPEVE
jgi:hypothetical protein